MASAKMQLLILGDAASAKAALDKTAVSAEESSSRIGKAGSKLSETFKDTVKTFVPLAAGFAAADFAKGAIEGAEKLEKANRSLETSLKAVGGGAEKLLPQFQQTAKAAAEFGINQTQATQSLSRAVLITHNAQAAQRAYNEAVVISKATGKDLNAVLLATAKAQDGQTGSLTRYGVVLKKGADGQQQFNAVMGAFKGQAEANTSASDKLSADWDNLQTQIGSKLLPAFDAIVGGLDNVIAWFESPEVAAAVSAFTTTIQTYIQPVIDWIRNNWPEIKQVIVTVIDDAWAAVKGVIAIFKAGWQEFGGTIKTIATNDFHAIEGIVKGIVQTIKGVVELVKGIAHGDWSQVWQGLKDIAMGPINGLLAALKGTFGNFTAIMGKLGSIILSALGAGLNAGKRLLLDALDAAIIDPINAVIGVIDSVHIHIPKVHIPLVGDIGGGDISLNVPKVPRLDTGGLVEQTGLAVVHRGEVFSGVGPNAKGFGGPDVTVNVHGFVGNETQLAEQIGRVMTTAMRGGRVPGFTSAVRTA